MGSIILLTATKSDWMGFWSEVQARKALEAPLTRLMMGGHIQVRTNAANEVVIRVASNIASLYRRDRPPMRLGGAKPVASSLVYSRISQTDPKTGEIIGITRARKFTREAKHYIREAAGCLEEKYGKDVWFITVTLPGSTTRAIEGYAMCDKEIKNAFLQNFRKLYRKVFGATQGSLDYLCVSELQRRGAIHLHIALGWASDRYARIVKRCYRRWWHKVLLHYSEKLGIDLFEREGGDSWSNFPSLLLVECEKVKKSVGAYLSKYLSKQSSKLRVAAINSPSRWWSVSMPLRQKVNAARCCVTKMVTTRHEALVWCQGIVEQLNSQGYNFLETIAAWSGELVGWVCMPQGVNRKHIFEAACLLLRRDEKNVYWEEERYAWVEVQEGDEETNFNWSDTT
jgi:hypothetical protein